MNPLFYDLIRNTVTGNSVDRSPRGCGNRAARRAAKLPSYRDHVRWSCEDIYTDRPKIFLRADFLRVNDSALKNGVVLTRFGQ